MRFLPFWLPPYQKQAMRFYGHPRALEGYVSTPLFQWGYERLLSRYESPTFSFFDPPGRGRQGDCAAAWGYGGASPMSKAWTESRASASFLLSGDIATSLSVDLEREVAMSLFFFRILSSQKNDDGGGSRTRVSSFLDFKSFKSFRRPKPIKIQRLMMMKGPRLQDERSPFTG